MKNFIIIGAGLSGLIAAQKLSEKNLGKVLILEKSRGIGGRIATRRTLGTRFDHGAQFYRLKDDIFELHQEWKKEDLSQLWFTSSKGEHWCSPQGLKALPKKLASSLDIKLEKQNQYNSIESNYWSLKSDKEEEWQCEHLIISAPLPQALALIEQSGLDNLLHSAEFKELKKINYSKALVALITLENELASHQSGYEEYESGEIFSVSDQKKKGVSTDNAITVTMSDTFSENYFLVSEEIALKEILKIVHLKFPEAKIISSELKKWRYCKPNSIYPKKFLEIAPKLYLIGDSFGGSSLLGAIRSANALALSF